MHYLKIACPIILCTVSKRFLPFDSLSSSILEELAVQFGTSSVLYGVLSLVFIDFTVLSGIEAGWG